MQITDILTDSTGQPLAFTPMVWQMMAGAATYTGGGVAIGQPVVITTDADGKFSSFMAAGNYTVTVNGVDNSGTVVEDGSAFWTLSQVFALPTPALAAVPVSNEPPDVASSGPLYIQNGAGLWYRDLTGWHGPLKLT